MKIFAISLGDRDLNFAQFRFETFLMALTDLRDGSERNGCPGCLRLDLAIRGYLIDNSDVVGFSQS